MNEKPVEGSVEYALAAFRILPPASKRRVLQAIQEDEANVLMNDAELCELLGISVVTLRKYLAAGPPESAKGNGNTLDVRMIQRTDVGLNRRWLRSSVMALINGE